MSQDIVTMTVPAKGAYAKTVRMTAAALAARLDMSYDEVEDVRLAAEEAFVYAADTVAEGEDLTFIFTVGDGVIALEVGLGSKRLTDEDVAGAHGGGRRGQQGKGRESHPYCRGQRSGLDALSCGQAGPRPSGHGFSSVRVQSEAQRMHRDEPAGRARTTQK